MKKNYILNLMKLFSLTAMALGLVFVTSCGGDDDGDPVPTMTIAQIIASDEYKQSASVSADKALDSLAKLIAVYPELSALVGGSAEYTLFAPSNAGFKALMETPGFPADIRQINPDIVKKVLSYHLVAGTKLSADLTSGTALTAADDEQITINADGTLNTGSTDKAIKIQEGDLKATNGVVHITNKVLIPPTIGNTLTALLPTIAGPVALGADFTTLWQGIQLADAFAAGAEVPSIMSYLTGTDAVTFFAPTNATFEAGGITPNAYTGEQWYGIISNHLVSQDDNTIVTEEEMFTGATFTSKAGKTLLVIEGDPTNGTGVYIDSNGDFNPTAPDPTKLNAEVVIFNVAARGASTIHVIAGVLSPQ